MGLMDELRKLTTPYDEDENFIEGDEKEPAAPSKQQSDFESTFGSDPGAAPEPVKKTVRQRFSGENARPSVFQRAQKTKAPVRENVVNFGGSDMKVILFSPRSFDEASELVDHLKGNRSVVMTLEGVQADTARRLLDFLSGVTYGLGGKITPVAGKTYFIAPASVDVVGTDQPEADGQYL